jgi:hypothetical protein
MSSKKKPTAKSNLVITQEVIQAIRDEKEKIIDTYEIGDGLTAKDRQRLHAVGIKGHGFVDEAFEIAEQNPDFLPTHFNIDKMTKNMKILQDMRELSHELEQFQQVITECLYIFGSKSYKDSLRIYATVKEAAKNKVEGAQPLYAALMGYFKKKKRVTGEESVKDIEKDVKHLLAGTADGEVIIKNETPKTSGGTRTVVDNVKKGKSVTRNTSESERDE